MSSHPIITVFGATGAQGGGLVRAVLADANAPFAVRAVTRKPDSAPAQALARAGAEIVVADLDDSASLRRVLDGAQGAYLVTNFWEHFSPEKELAQARNLAAACAHANVRHAIWSTLEDTRAFFPADGTRMPVLQGKYNVPHFDAKGEANRLFVEHGVPTTFLYTSGYWDNMIHFGLGPKRGPDGSLAIAFPTGDKRIPWIAVEDIGRSAYGIFKYGPDMAGQSIGIAGEHLTGAQLAAELTQALGEQVTYHSMTPEAYRSLGFPGADELGNMYQFKRDFETEYCARRDPAQTRELNPRTQTFAQWLQQHKSRIPL